MSTLRLVTPCSSGLECEWAQDYLKHRPHRGMRRSDTRHGPARYLPGTTLQQIQELEEGTVFTGIRQAVGTNKSEYTKDVGRVIGWDAGQDATWSFVECSGGMVTGRRFHGRPMAGSNHKLGGMS